MGYLKSVFFLLSAKGNKISSINISDVTNNVGYSGGVLPNAVTLSHSPTARLGLISSEARAVSFVPICTLKLRKVPC